MLQLVFILHLQFDHSTAFVIMYKTNNDELLILLLLYCPPVNSINATRTWVLNVMFRHHVVRDLIVIYAYTSLTLLIRILVNLQDTTILFRIKERGHCMSPHNGTRNYVLSCFEEGDVIIESRLVVIF